MKPLSLLVIGFGSGLFVYNMNTIPEIETIEVQVCSQSEKERIFQDGMEREAARCPFPVKEVGYEPEYHECINEFDLMPQAYQYSQSDFQYLYDDGYSEGHNDAILSCSDSFNSGYVKGVQSCK